MTAHLLTALFAASLGAALILLFADEAPARAKGGSPRDTVVKVPDRDDYRLFKITQWTTRNALRLFEARTHRNEAGETMPYRLFIPSECRPEEREPEKRERKEPGGRRYPLVLFFHGATGRGTGNRKSITDFNALGPAVWILPEVQQEHPCFVLAPQCPPRDKWVAADWRSPSHVQPRMPSRALRLAMEVLQEVQEEFPVGTAASSGRHGSVDPDRIYVTGQSMGAFGVWDVAARIPERFAAAVPVCGGGDEETAPRIAHLPIWAFHGRQDALVMPARSRNMVEAIRRAGGGPRYTEYVGADHYIFVYAFLEKELVPWLFRQTRAGRPQPRSRRR